MLLFKKESFKLIGISMEIHRILGPGFSEVVYKDALEFELISNMILFEREKKFEIIYKDIILPHYFIADLVVFDSIIIEVKSVKEINDIHIGQTINYLKASGLNLGIIINFGQSSLEYKRIVI
jgi:GxxExxY protein